MKIVEMLGERNLQVVELPEPEPRDDFVVVKVMASTICGTEARTYHDPRSPEYAHYNSGHEATGIVWKTAPGARVAEGTRVAIHCDLGQHCERCENCYRGDWLRCLDPRPIISDWRGTHAQYILRRESECMALPDDVPFEIGSTLVDCAGTPYRGIRRLGVDGFDTVLITGLGPLGAAAAIICHALGATVIATEPSEYRLARAAEYGVDHPINPTDGDALARVMSLTAGRGVDVAMDFTGYTEPQLLCLDGVRSGGAVGFMGLKYDDTPDGPVPRSTPVTVAGHLLPKELTLIGSWCVGPDEYLQLVKLVQKGLPLERLITHRFSIDDAAEAFDTAFTQQGTKIIIDPWLE